jgi:hypothetical protein
VKLQVVIMVEGTGGIDFILPVIVAIVLSNWAAYHIHSAGAYESDLEHLGTHNNTAHCTTLVPTFVTPDRPVKMKLKSLKLSTSFSPWFMCIKLY